MAKFVGGVFFAVGVIEIVFVAGMRAKSPVVLNAVRRSGRATKQLVLKSSGTPGGIASVIRHVGRTTGGGYETPVQAVPTADGFVIALPYGPNTDWLKNVVVSGSATIEHEGNTYPVDRPEIVPSSVAAPLFSAKEQRTHRLFRVDEFHVVRRVEPDETGGSDRAWRGALVGRRQRVGGAEVVSLSDGDAGAVVASWTRAPRRGLGAFALGGWW